MKQRDNPWANKVDEDEPPPPISARWPVGVCTRPARLSGAVSGGRLS